MAETFRASEPNEDASLRESFLSKTHRIFHPINQHFFMATETTTTTTTTAEDEKNGAVIFNILGLLFFLGLAWWEYSTITAYEANGGYLRMPKPLMMMYQALGKWGVIGVWLALALYNLVRAIMGMRRK
jgi:hypothetical protein